MQIHDPFSVPNSVPAFAHASVARVLGLAACSDLYKHAQCMPKPLFADRVLNALNIHVHTDRHELVRIPRTGACVVTSNHPLGGADGLALLSVMHSIRPDVKILANSLLARIPELQEQLICVNPFGSTDSGRANVKGIREVYEWLNAGNALIVFPAGEVSDMHISMNSVIDKSWNSTIARIIRRTGAAVIPAFVHGRNSALFYISGKIHPRLRTLGLARELMNKRNTKISLRFGTIVSAAKSRAFANDDELIHDLRQRSYVLKHKVDEVHSSQTIHLAHDVIADAMPAEIMTQELGDLKAERLLCSHGDFLVYEAKAHEIPFTLAEIARLREVTFRYAGEGTGKDMDSDRFDQWYTHIFIWNQATREIVGAYRVGRCDEIVVSRGVRGMYTNTLFAFSKSFVQKISPALELGRSFVRIEYQKNHMPLMLLWRGIGEFISRNPHYRFLFGPVSISNDYSSPSRRLLVNSLMTYHYDRRLARTITPRRALSSSLFANWDALVNTYTSRDINHLSPVIRELEQDNKSVPVLLKQYLGLGGVVVGFNVDPQFENCIDALVVVDLHKTTSKYLDKYVQGVSEASPREVKSA